MNTASPIKAILVTGASGYVGQCLCVRLLMEGCAVRGTILASESPSSLVAGVEPVVIEPLSADTSWEHALTGVDAVIHLAARVHIMDDSSVDPLSEFRVVNTDGTKRLARMAAVIGVRRFVFISSVKVNGEDIEIPYTEQDVPAPEDPYGISKWEAEQSLREIEAETWLEVVILRPPLVYGPGVKANFLRLLKIVQRGVPLPLASIENCRSFVYLGNLVDAITICINHPKAAGHTYLVSDGEDVSTPELIRRLCASLGVAARLLPFPQSIMRLLGRIIRKTASVDRLLGSLVIDSGKIRRELGWVPPFTMEQGLNETAAWFKREYRAK